MLVHSFLADAATRTPDATAIVDPVRSISFGALNHLSNQYSRFFQSHGVQRGDRIVIALDNSITMVAAYMGTLKAGAVAVPLPGGGKGDRLAAAILDCTPKVCVVDAAAARAMPLDHPARATPVLLVAGDQLDHAIASVPSDPVEATGSPDDLAAIIYTSGSTGEPRGVMLSHQNFAANARSIVQYLELRATDSVMCVLPFSYVYGLSLLHTHLLVGGTVVIDNRFVFPNLVLQAMREHRVTGFAGVPSTFALLLHRSSLQHTPLPDLRYVTQAGGAMPAARIVEWLERGPQAEFYVMYGATEAAARLTYLPPSDVRRKLGSIGRPIPDVEITVMTEQGEAARPGEIGELVARGPNIAAGYWNRPQETATRFGPFGYRTGDLGYVDDEGYFYLVGRLHDMIKVGGNRVGAKEIEDVLHEHPAVSEAAVVSVEHDVLEEVPIAFVTTRTPLDDPENVLRGFCAGRLAAFKVPVRVLVEQELPKLPATGKIDKTTLRTRARSGLERGAGLVRQIGD